MIINGTQCVTLGHNFQGDVVGHAYFGSQKVVNDLKRMNGWGVGRVSLPSDCFVRDRTSNLVVGMQQ